MWSTQFQMALARIRNDFKKKTSKVKENAVALIITRVQSY